MNKGFTFLVLLLIIASIVLVIITKVKDSDVDATDISSNQDSVEDQQATYEDQPETTEPDTNLDQVPNPEPEQDTPSMDTTSTHGSVSISIEDDGSDLEFNANIEGEVYLWSYYNGVKEKYIPTSWELYKLVNNEWVASLQISEACPTPSCPASCESQYAYGCGEAGQEYLRPFNNRVSYDWDKTDYETVTQTCPTFTINCLNQETASGTYKVVFRYKSSLSSAISIVEKEFTI